MKPIVIGKVGGSLFDLPDLASRLRRWRETVAEATVILVPGGGAGADVIRRLDQAHGLGEEAAHWLALRVLSVNARVLARLLRVAVVSLPGEAISPTCVLDAFDFCQHDDMNDGALPHCWNVTSDTIAARVAAVSDGRLVLLKSVERPPDSSWADATRAGWVDPAFPKFVTDSGVEVTWTNLRSEP